MNRLQPEVNEKAMVVRKRNGLMKGRNILYVLYVWFWIRLINLFFWMFKNELHKTSFVFGILQVLLRPACICSSLNYRFLHTLESL